MNRPIAHKLLGFLLALTVALAALPACADMETGAKQAILIDINTGAALLEKNADERMTPSSMSKLMTLYILFSALKDGRVKLDDKFVVSEKAWRMQGSKSFVKVGDEVSVNELIQGIAIQSGNDACIVIAEGLKGSEDAFAQEMNRQASALGLAHSHFANATGWPDEQHYMTARDLSELARRIITDFPQYYHYFSEQEYTYNGIKQGNRNLLLGGNLGVDGLKTGHTDAGGYGITLSAKDASGRRLLLVINGLESDKARQAEGDRLLRYGFREFEDKKLVSKGQPLDTAQVWFGTKSTVPLVADADKVATLPVSGMAGFAAKLVYDDPIPAPVARGAHVGELQLTIPGQQEVVKIPVAAAEDVPRLSGFGKLLAVLEHTVFHKK